MEVPGVVLEMVSGEGRWRGSGLTCLCTPNDNDVVVIVLLLTAGAYGGKGGDPRGGSGDGER